MDGLIENKLWLGFDLSTQQVSQGRDVYFDCDTRITVKTLTFQLKSIAINENLEVVCEASVQFDTDLPEFR